MKNKKADVTFNLQFAILLAIAVIVALIIFIYGFTGVKEGLAKAVKFFSSR